MSTAFVVDAGLFEGDDVMQYSIAMPAITESVLDEGVVLAYLGFDGSRWAAMPVVVPSFGSSTTLGFAFEISTFLLQLQTDLDDDHSDPSGVRALVASLFDGASVRVVTIPPTASKHDLDYADYEAVAKFYGID